MTENCIVDLTLTGEQVMLQLVEDGDEKMLRVRVYRVGKLVADASVNWGASLPVECHLPTGVVLTREPGHRAVLRREGSV